MSAEAHFRAAAAELRRAITEKQHDIEVLKKQVTEKEQMVRQYIDQLRQDKRQKERLSGSKEMDTTQRMDLERAAQQNLVEETNAQQGLGKDKDIIRKSVDAIQRDIMDLERRARDLETRT
jgi:hypothetical protein